MDMQAVLERDPACRGMLQPFLFFKGFLALQTQRVANRLWREGRETLAFHFQSRSSELFGVDIHPAVKMGRGIMLDHATNITIGETAVVGDGCSILQGVTLGGTGKEVGDRHPKIGRGVLVSVGAKVLGNITVGDEAKIAAGSVVLKDVPAHTTVAGVPARIVGGEANNPARSMDQTIPDTK
jgi:serine O-acetyltransferase